MKLNFKTINRQHLLELLEIKFYSKVFFCSFRLISCFMINGNCVIKCQNTEKGAKFSFTLLRIFFQGLRNSIPNVLRFLIAKNSLNLIPEIKKTNKYLCFFTSNNANNWIVNSATSLARETNH